MNAPASASLAAPATDRREPLSQAAFRAAREDAARSGRNLIDVLEERGGLTSSESVACLADALGYGAARMADLNRAAPAFDLLPYPEAARRACVLVRREDDSLALVFGDPLAPDLHAWAEERIGQAFERVLAHPADLAAYVARYEDKLRAMDGVVEAAAEVPSGGGRAEDLSLVSISEDASPVVKLVHSTLYDAMKIGASDIHIETRARDLVIKYRIDGVLTQVGMLQGREQAEQVISRIKVMSELDISETRVPQDGRLKVTTKGREVDVRVSILPSIFGEDAVLRVLDKETLADRTHGLTLNQLGLDEGSVAGMRRLSREPYGMLLVTGPTGSGKTTTLYAAISEINSGEDKIITIEDPVEYQLPGVLQIPVNEKKGLTFARGLRSVLRHDPDTIMVGEIRDPETAQIAVQAALTGHLVFTTVHANNVFDVLGRFHYMNVDAHSFVSALKGIVAQRLVRLNCPHCSIAEEPPREVLEESGIAREAAASFSFRHGTGCGACRGSGYRGRKAIAEVLRMNDEMSNLIVSRAPAHAVREGAARAGMRPLRDAALNLVRAGETTLQEINRVTAVA
jgi:general secretion pathway protein E